MTDRIRLEGMKAPLLEVIAELWRDSGRITPLKTRGFSMRPLIHEQDEVSISHVGPDRIRMGDIAAFRTGPAVIVHRIVGVKNLKGKRVFLEKGDNLMSLSLVEEERLLGRIVAVTPAGRRPMDLTRARWRAVGVAVSLYGRAALRLARVSCRLGRFLARESAPGLSALARRAQNGVLLLPPRVGLTLCKWVL